MRRSLALITLGALLLAGGFAAGHQPSSRSVSRPPIIRLEHGVPVAVRNSPAGAIAAADNYLAAEDQALTAAGALRQVVGADWAPADRATELSRPFPAATLAGRPQTFAGLKLTAAVAATKLVSYAGGDAEVGVWHEVTVWSSAVEPTQRWMLDTVGLRWSSGQWVIASRSSAPDAHTPVPAWTNGTTADRTTGAFESRLAGMSVPYYEGAGS
jgi:hypothetical protein